MEMPNLSDEGFPPLPKVLRLSLEGTHMDASILDALVAGAPELQSLDLSRTQIKPEKLVVLTKLKRLSKLSLAFLKVREKDLCVLHALSELRSLDVSGTRVRAATTLRCLPDVHLSNDLVDQLENPANAQLRANVARRCASLAQDWSSLDATKRVNRLSNLDGGLTVIAEDMGPKELAGTRLLDCVRHTRPKKY